MDNNSAPSVRHHCRRYSSLFRGIANEMDRNHALDPIVGGISAREWKNQIEMAEANENQPSGVSKSPLSPRRRQIISNTTSKTSSPSPFTSPLPDILLSESLPLASQLLIFLSSKETRALKEKI